MLHAAAMEGELSSWLDQIGPILFYLAVWGLVFVGTAFFVGAFIPFITGDSLLFAAGIIAATSDSISIWVLAIGVGIAAFLSDQVAYWLGIRLGRPYLDTHGGPRTQKAIRKTESFYRLFGWWSVVIARFMPWGRVFIPVIAGIGRMGYLRFATANLVGSLAWGVGITVIGYFAASNPTVRGAAYVIAGVFITLSIVMGIRAWREDRRQPEISAASQPPASQLQ